MVAMCFNLMQEEVRAKFRWLGQKLGMNITLASLSHYQGFSNPEKIDISNN
jgi:hypothetical protein